MNESCGILIRDLHTRDLEVFLDWLRLQVDGGDDDITAELRQKHFDFYKGYAEELERQVRDGKMPRSEAERLRHISAYLTVRHASAFILNDKLVRARLNRVFAEFRVKIGEESDIPEVDLDGLRHAVLREQTDKLREICYSAL